ncbi:Uncharacterized protein TCAP_01434 [Tolypocladium capitatum]|uniref:Uncharacterized protein n=1 Tax=Tolypocladium capitatum TaxID=45235 RepID=A0A2K3QM85_9HYPO|nr:Uncharacterized protein TCAP_01434 [Tolypocladium capitatum]
MVYQSQEGPRIQAQAQEPQRGSSPAEYRVRWLYLTAWPMRLQKRRTHDVRLPVIDDVDDDDANDSADPIIDRTRSYLWSQNISKRGTWFKDELGTSKISRKLFGRAPWHRKSSDGLFSSVASSVREVLQGGTPPATPMLVRTSSDFNFKLANSQFPGGEAVRVSTPPLDEDTADGKPRGFFTCTTPANKGPGNDSGNDSGDDSGNVDSLTPHTPPARSASRHGYRRGSRPAPTREWWEPMPQRTKRREPPVAPGDFQFDLPEHLPSSPMCPANVRHASSGTGMCVYHGRGSAKATLGDGRSRGESSGSGSGMGGEDEAKRKNHKL